MRRSITTAGAALALVLLSPGPVAADPGGLPPYGSCGVGKFMSAELRANQDLAETYGVEPAPGASEIAQMSPVGSCAGPG